MIIYFLVRHLGEKSILWVFSLTCWGLTGSQHISTTLTILHYLDLKVAAWVTCFRCTYFEIMLEGANHGVLEFKIFFLEMAKKRGGRKFRIKTKHPPKDFAKRRYQKRIRKDAHSILKMLTFSQTKPIYCKYACCWKLKHDGKNL